MIDSQIEEKLLSIIKLMSLTLSKELELYTNSINQIKRLISDASEKININDLTNPTESDAEKVFEKDNVSNLLSLLHKSLDMSKLINKKMDGIMRAVQIDDIAGQISDEVLSRIYESEQFLSDIQSSLKNYKDKPLTQQKDLLLAIDTKITKLLEKKDKKHVQQNNLDEGSIELF